MPFVYCSQCEQPIPDWREALSGCHHCGEKYYEIDDVGARMVIDHLIDEIDELQESKKRLNKLEDWLWGKHHQDCPHRDRSQRSGMGDGCNVSITHGCSRNECHTFPRKGGD